MEAARNASANEPTVLVVEDDPLVRLDMAEELRGRGVVVIEAGDAQQATTVLKSGRRVDLVFSDVQMPGIMNGFDLAAWIWLRRPGVKVLLASGHVRGSRGAGPGGEAAFIEKPYHTESVARRILHDIVPAH